MSYFSHLHLFSSPKKKKKNIDSKEEPNKQEKYATCYKGNFAIVSLDMCC